MEILVGHGFGPQTERILRYYWDRLSMVARLGRYYGTPFKGHQGVTQGGLISPTIFNMVVNAVICHWVMMLAGEGRVPYGFGRAFQWMAEFFYKYDGLLASPMPARIQAALDVLTGFPIGWASRPMQKTVGMVC